MAEWRLKLEFCYHDPNLECIYPDGEPDWTAGDEPYVDTLHLDNEAEATAAYQEAKEILALDDASDVDPNQAQQDFPIKHGIVMCDIDGNDYGAKLALSEVLEFVKTEDATYEFQAKAVPNLKPGAVLNALTLAGIGLLDDGKVAVGLVQSWTADGAVDDRMIAGDVADWARKYHARAVAFDRWTGAGIASRLASVGIPVGDVSGQLFAQACDATLSSMTAGRLVHGNQPDLTAAVMACAKKPMADGGWRVIRRGSAVHISAAVAMIMAIQYASEPQPTVEIITV